MEKYLWSHLNKHQLGSYAKYCVKTEFAMYGFQINETDTDEHGYYFVASYNKGSLLEVQVRSVRQLRSYAFLHKTKFELNERRYLAFAFLLEGEPPSLYLIPSTRWRTPDNVFVDRGYEGLQSEPEWGLVTSAKNLEFLKPYVFETTIDNLITGANG